MSINLDTFKSVFQSSSRLSPSPDIIVAYSSKREGDKITFQILPLGLNNKDSEEYTKKMELITQHQDFTVLKFNQMNKISIPLSETDCEMDVPISQDLIRFDF